jgi:hypothetical protein
MPGVSVFDVQLSCVRSDGLLFISKYISADSSYPAELRENRAAIRSGSELGDVRNRQQGRRQVQTECLGGAGVDDPAGSTANLLRGERTRGMVAETKRDLQLRRCDPVWLHYRASRPKAARQGAANTTATLTTAKEGPFHQG